MTTAVEMQSSETTVPPVQRYTLEPFGDSCVYLRFESGDLEMDWRRSHSVNHWLRGQKFDFLVSSYTTFDTTLIEFEPTLASPELIIALLHQTIAGYDPGLESWLDETRTFDVPVVYGGQYGIDLEEVAAEQRMTVDELIQEHSSRAFTIRCFSPGGGAMMSNPTTIRDVPRLASPRIGTTPPGRISLAGMQCGMHPKGGHFTSGWRLVGCTPSLIMDRESDVEPVKFSVGDKVRFRRIEEFEWSSYEGVPLRATEGGA